MKQEQFYNLNKQLREQLNLETEEVNSFQNTHGWCLLEGSDDWKVGNVSDLGDLLVNHKSKDSEHGGTAVVQFDGTLLKLGLFIEFVPAEVDVSVTEVTWEFGHSWDLLHEGDLKESNEADDLSNSVEWDGIRSTDGGNSVGERVEGVSREVDVSWKVDSGTWNNVSKEGKHTDTSVLDLDVTKTVELLLVTIGNKSKRIEESKRRLGTKGILEGVQGGGLGSLLDRGEGRGSSDKRGKDGGLHGDQFVFDKLCVTAGTWQQINNHVAR